MKRLWRWLIWNLRGRPRIDICDYLYETMMRDMKREQSQASLDLRER